MKSLIKITVVALLPAITLWAKPPAKNAALSIGDLSWMAGRWQSAADGDLTDEHWTEPVGGSMVGMCRLGRNAPETIYELLLIEENGDKLVYTMEHFGPGLKHRDKAPLVFDVSRGIADREIVFQSRDTARPTRLTYRLESDDRLVVVLERKREGKDLRDEFRMHRVVPR